MKISIELSLYPLHPEYKSIIKGFIQRLKDYESVDTVVDGMSTKVFGEYDRVMTILNAEMKRVFDGPDKVVIIMKCFNGDRSNPVKL